MKFIIIGLGNYGRCLSEELSALGHEIIGVDNNEHHINSVKDKIAVSYIIDIEEEGALSVLPINAVDAVIVCIGEDFGASVKVVSFLKKLEVKHIYARAIDSTHRAILEAFSIDKILAPEEEAARNLAFLLDYSYNIDSMKLDEEYYIVRFYIPKNFVNYTVDELQLYENFNVKVIAVQHSNEGKNVLGVRTTHFKTVMSSPSQNEMLSAGDKLVCIGKNEDIKKLLNSI